MPAPVYSPDGSASASPITTSINDTPPGWEMRSRASDSARSGITAPLRANSSRFGRKRSPMSMSLNVALPWPVTTRIISSGVTPLAHSAAMNDPAEVPTYTSKLLTVLFTASRSSARSAPISYTPPVKPPPPNTRAVLDRVRRRDPAVREPAPGRSVAAVSSLTTLPIPTRIVGSRAPAATFDRAGGYNPPMRVFFGTLGAILALLAATAAGAAAQTSPQEALQHALGRLST